MLAEYFGDEAAAIADHSAAAAQLCRYLAACCETLGSLPDDRQIIFERFYDEAGDGHLVIHSPLGSRINRAWGLALRKRFCRKFNFELQAAALEDSIVISLSAMHSFPIEEPARYLNSNSVAHVFEQALLDVPVFVNRWRWCAANALAIRRRQSGGRTPAPIQRSRSEDLLAQVFPDQVACQENLSGERDIPDHPLVRQTVADCAGEFMDLAGLEQLIEGLERGEVRVLGCELAAPSPMAEEVLLARPYAFIDDAPAEERRTNAVRVAPDADVLARAADQVLSQQAMDRVAADCVPPLRNAEELHDALLVAGFVPRPQLRDWLAQAAMRQGAGGSAADNLDGWVAKLAADGRLKILKLPAASAAKGAQRELLVATERWPEILALHPQSAQDSPTAEADSASETSAALLSLLRGRMQLAGMVTGDWLTADFAGLASPAAVKAALLTLESEGFATRFNWQGEELWSERGLLVRMHRYSLVERRERIKPVTATAYMRFLLRWHGFCEDDKPEGAAALERILSHLDGFETAAGAWESGLLAPRMGCYSAEWLDQLCLSGAVSWCRLSPPTAASAGLLTTTTPLALMPRTGMDTWRKAATAHAAGGQGPLDGSRGALSSRAAAVLELLRQRGALFYDELSGSCRLLPSQLQDALRELAAAGVVTADSFGVVRTLISARRRNHRRGMRDLPGRWQALGEQAAADSGADWQYEDEEALALTLLRRYGVLFRRLAMREQSYLPPWRLLLAALRRMEAAGRVRGGRFVQGVFGEQFALPEAVDMLAKAARSKPGDCAVVSACDPVNLTGVLDTEERIAAVPGHRILYRDGRALAALVARNRVRILSDSAPSPEQLHLLRTGSRPPAPIPKGTGRRPAHSGAGNLRRHHSRYR